MPVLLLWGGALARVVPSFLGEFNTRGAVGQMDRASVRGLTTHGPVDRCHCASTKPLTRMAAL